MIKFLLLNSDKFYRKRRKKKMKPTIIEVEHIDVPAYYIVWRLK